MWRAKRAFRGLPLGHPCPMRGAVTPTATEGKRPSGWEILCALWRARSLALAPFVRPCVLTRERQWLCLRVLSISPEPLRLGGSALKNDECFCPFRASISSSCIPRALPWADCSLAFQAAFPSVFPPPIRAERGPLPNRGSEGNRRLTECQSAPNDRDLSPKSRTGCGERGLQLNIVHKGTT